MLLDCRSGPEELGLRGLAELLRVQPEPLRALIKFSLKGGQPMFKKLFFSLIIVFLVLGSTCLGFAQIKANAGTDQTVHPGDEVTLDGAGSTGPDGAVLGYYWNKRSPKDVSLSLPVKDKPREKF
jgi:hypothetical protein